MSARALLLCLAIAAAHLAAGAQPIYRCGNAYGDLPCSLQRVPEIRRADAPRTVSDPPAPAWADSPPQYDAPYWSRRGGRGWHGQRGDRAGHQARQGGGSRR